MEFQSPCDSCYFDFLRMEVFSQIVLKTGS